MARTSADMRCHENVVRQRAVLRMQELAVLFPELRDRDRDRERQAEALARFVWFMSRGSLESLSRDCPGLIETMALHQLLFGIAILVVEGLPDGSPSLGVN